LAYLAFLWKYREYVMPSIMKLYIECGYKIVPPESAPSSGRPPGRPTILPNLSQFRAGRLLGKVVHERRGDISGFDHFMISLVCRQ
jgi:hypothetical protein